LEYKIQCPLRGECLGVERDPFGVQNPELNSFQLQNPLQKSLWRGLAHGVDESGPLEAVHLSRHNLPNEVGKLQPPAAQGLSAEQVLASAYRDTSLIRKCPPSEDPPRILGIGLR
jgi:hypothetical protein